MGIMMWFPVVSAILGLVFLVLMGCAVYMNQPVPLVCCFFATVRCIGVSFSFILDDE